MKVFLVSIMALAVFSEMALIHAAPSAVPTAGQASLEKVLDALLDVVENMLLGNDTVPSNADKGVIQVLIGSLEPVLATSAFLKQATLSIAKSTFLKQATLSITKSTFLKQATLSSLLKNVSDVIDSNHSVDNNNSRLMLITLVKILIKLLPALLTVSPGGEAAVLIQVIRIVVGAIRALLAIPGAVQRLPA